MSSFSCSLGLIFFRRHLSDLMVKNGIMEWLLEKLDPGPLKKYTLEYSTSLIMNLAICIPPSFWDNREKCIFCIIKLLKTSHRQVNYFSLVFLSINPLINTFFFHVPFVCYNLLIVLLISFYVYIASSCKIKASNKSVYCIQY